MPKYGCFLIFLQIYLATVLEPPMYYQRDDMERERERQLEEFRRQREERQRDWEQRREQLRAEQEANARRIAEEPKGRMVGPPSGDGGVPVPEEHTTPEPQSAPMANTATVGTTRRRFLLPLLLTLVLLIAFIVACTLAYALLASSGGGQHRKPLNQLPTLTPR